MAITLTKAIEILRLNLKLAGRTMPPDTQSAVSVGIESIQLIINHRGEGLPWLDRPLPSEEPQV